MTDDLGWTPVLAFDTDDVQFSRGFEAGRLWELLKCPAEVSQMIHASNAEMVLRMGESLKRTVRADCVDDFWIDVFSEEVS